MEIERLIGQAPSTIKQSDAMTAQQSTWTRVPEDQRINASISVIHIVPSNGSTETRVNPTDPGDGFYLERPYPPDTVKPAGRMRYS